MQHQLLLLQQGRQFGQLQVHDPGQVLGPQGPETDHLINAIQQLRTELLGQGPVHRLAQGRVALGLLLGGGLGTTGGPGAVQDRPAGQVAGHHHHRVAEIDRAALGIAQAAVIEHLQQDVEHIGVGLLHLIKQQHRIGPAPHRLGELAALLVAHVAGGGPQQPGHGIALHEFAHVEPHQGLLLIEEGGG